MSRPAGREPQAARERPARIFSLLSFSPHGPGAVRGLRFELCGLIDKIFLMLTLSDTHEGRHTLDPDLDSADIFESMGRTRPSDIPYV